MYDRAVRQTSDDAALHMRRGFLLQALDQRPEALAAYRTATDLDPANPAAQYGLGKMLRETGQIAEGEALMAMALGADPQAGEAYDDPLTAVRIDR